MINGGGGFDIIDGGTGADDIDGGTGTDRVVYEGRTSGVTVTLAGGADDGNAEDDNGFRRDNISRGRAGLRNALQRHARRLRPRTTS